MLSAPFAYALVFAAFVVIFPLKLKLPEMPAKVAARVSGALEIILMCLFAASFLPIVFSGGAIWLDEAFSLDEIKRPWGEMIRLIAHDVHPPLYFIILKSVSRIFGSGIAVMRMATALPVILTAVVASRFLKREFSGNAAKFLLISLAIPKGVLNYGTQIRMYGWGLFFITMTAVSAHGFFKRGAPRRFAVLLLCAVAAAYTHNFAAGIGYALMFVYAVRRRRDKIKPLLLLALCGVLLYSPWIPALVGQFGAVAGETTKEPFTSTDVLKCVYTVFSTGNVFADLMTAIIFPALLTRFFIRKNKTENDWFVFGGLCCVFLTALFGSVVSVAVCPVFVHRYLFPSCGLVWLFFAAECGAIANKRVVAFLYVVTAALALTSFTGSVSKTRQDNRGFAAFHNHMTELVREGDIFYVIEGKSEHMTGIAAFLFPDNTVVRDSRHPNRAFENVFGDRIAEYSPVIFGENTVWIIDTTRKHDALPFGLKTESHGAFGWRFYKFNLHKSSSAASAPRR
ncbi:MAG: glycosyltransferase family 39 protein [Kiritimatiellaeota bacterium]|nr:glycosyltransferase family 39 protein [Kiritimatiellota bacterium]